MQSCGKLQLSLVISDCLIAAEEATDTRLLLGPVRARVGGLDWQVAGTQWERCAATKRHVC